MSPDGSNIVWDPPGGTAAPAAQAQPTAKLTRPDFTEAFSRGLKTTIPQDKELLGGAGIAAGQLIGSEGLTQGAAKLYREGKAEAEPFQGPSLGDVIHGKAPFRNWAGNTLGNLSGQAIQSGIAGAVGALAGGVAGSEVPVAGTAAGSILGGIAGAVGEKGAMALAREQAEKYLAEQAAKGVAKDIAEQGAKKIIHKAAVGEAKRLGAFTGATIPNTVQEIGSAVQDRLQGGTKPEDITTGQAAGAIAAGTAAGLIDTATEAVNLAHYFGAGSKQAKLLRRVVTQALGGASREGGTEMVQSFLERLGGGAPLNNDAAWSDYLESGAAGALGGGVFDAPAGIHRVRNPAAQPGSLSDAANTIDDDTAAKATAAQQAQQAQQQPAKPKGPIERASDAAAEATPVQPVASAEPDTAALAAVPWINRETGEARAPTDSEVLDKFHQLQDAVDAGQITQQQANPSKLLADAWGVDHTHLRALAKAAKSEREAGITPATRASAEEPVAFGEPERLHTIPIPPGQGEAADEQSGAAAGGAVAPVRPAGAAEAVDDHANGAAGQPATAAEAAPAPAAAAPQAENRPDALTPPWIDPASGQATRQPKRPELVQALADYVQRKFEQPHGSMRFDEKALAEQWGVPAKDLRAARRQATALASQRIQAGQQAERPSSSSEEPRAPEQATLPAVSAEPTAQTPEPTAPSAGQSPPAATPTPPAPKPIAGEEPAPAPQPTAPTEAQGSAVSETPAAAAAEEAAPSADDTATAPVPAKADEAPAYRLALDTEDLAPQPHENKTRKEWGIPRQVNRKTGSLLLRTFGGGTLADAEAAFDALPANGAKEGKRLGDDVLAAARNMAAKRTAAAPEAAPTSGRQTTRATAPEAPRIEALGTKGLLVHGNREAIRGKLAAAGFKKKGRVQNGALRFDATDRPAIEKALGKASAKGPTGARAYSRNGTARVRAAQALMREAIKNEDMAPAARADAIAERRNLVQYMETHAAKDELPTVTVAGDQAVVTGPAKDGFEPIMWTEGHRAGREGVREVPALAKDATARGDAKADTTAALASDLAPRAEAQEQVAREAKNEATPTTPASKPRTRRNGLAPNGARVHTHKGKLAYVPGAPETLAAYFQPGRVVPGYRGPQQVVAFHPATGEGAGEGWTVETRSVDSAGNPTDEVHRHATAPSPKEVTKVLGPPTLAETPTKGKAGAGTRTDTASTKEAGDTARRSADLDAQSTTPAPIQDFGEKLGGARKDQAPTLSAELSEGDIASKPLSEIWPLSEVEAITDPFAAAVATAARAEVPAKPRRQHRLARWVDKVKAVRELARAAIDGTLTREKLAAVPALRGFAAKVELLQQIDRDQWGRIGEVHWWPDAFRYERDGTTTATPSIRVKVDGRWTDNAAAGTRDMAVAVRNLATWIKPLLAKSAKGQKLAFEIRRAAKPDDRGHRFFINKKGDREYRRLKTFATVDEARAYQRNHHEALVNAWEAVKERDNVTKGDMRRKGNGARQGPDYRDGADVTPEQFQDTFGFRGTEFGNWVKQGKNARERQGMLNQSYDALMDLAAVIGVPPRALSLNGTLGLALGARGHGWASAHYEPDRLVINLTKTRGAGSLAHEFFHALDNYFARSRGAPQFTGNQAAYNRQAFVTYLPEPVYVSKRTGQHLSAAQLAAARKANPHSTRYEESEWVRDPDHPKGVRPEVEKAFAALVNTLDASPMAKRAIAIDKGKVDGYWSRIVERAARSFENYVIAKSADLGIRNDYLANVVTPEEFRRAAERYPYLRPDELGPVAEAFDALFSTIETRETEGGNVALFNLPEDAPLFRAAEAPARASAADVAHLAKVNEIARAATAGWGPAQPRVRVLHSAELLPATAKRDPRYQRALGYYDGRTVYLIAPNLHSPRAVLKTLTHEAVGHYGVERIIDDELGPGAWGNVSASVAAMRARVREAQAANVVAGRQANAGLSRIQQVLAEVEARYGEQTDPETFAKETLAVLSEKGISNSWIDRAVTALRRWVRKLMPKLSLSPAELRQLLARSDAYLRAPAREPETYRARVARVQAAMFDHAPRLNTAAFTGWFKRSKVVDANGAPRVVYHGTAEDFPIFDDAKLASSTGHMTAPLGHFFAEDRAKAQRYAEKAAHGVPADENVMPVYLAIQQPKTLTVDELLAIDSHDEARALRKRLQAEGYDGIHLADIGQWVAFDNRQIKSVANRGSFDPDNPNIYFAHEARARTEALPATAATPAALWRNDKPLKALPEYAAAKAGDAAAAVRLVERVAQPLLQQAAGWGPNVIYVAPHAEEVAGPNAIPRTLAAYLAVHTGGTPDTSIVQTNRAYHTGADAMQRLLARSTFDGEVAPGARYVIVDDVSTMGGTLADLADYILAGGGEVVGSAVLVNASRAGTMKAPRGLLRQLERRYGDEIRNQFHVEPAALTADEARYLIGFRTADELRNRAATAERARAERLRAKGIQRRAQEGVTPAAELEDPAPDSGKGNFSLPAENIDRIEQVMGAPDAGAWQRAKDWMGGKYHDVKPALLGALQLRHLLELMQGLPIIADLARGYGNLFQQMDADRNAIIAGAADAKDHPDDVWKAGSVALSQRWQKLAYKGWQGVMGHQTVEAKRLSKLMNDATIAGVDPAEGYSRTKILDHGEYVEWDKKTAKDRIKALGVLIRSNPGEDKAAWMEEIRMLRALPKREATRKSEHAKLARRFAALSPEAQQLYRDARDWYAEYQNQVEDALLERVALLGGLPENRVVALQAHIRMQFEANRAQGVYFPLDRNGEYWMSVTDKDGGQGFRMFEHAADLKRAVDAAEAAGLRVVSGRRDTNMSAKKAPPGTFVGEVLTALRKAGVSEKTQDEVYQLFLRTLPEMSMRKHFIHRKKVPGYEADQLRAFAKNSFHGAHQLARLRYGHHMEATVESMRARIDDARQGMGSFGELAGDDALRADTLLHEIDKRHQWIMSPTDSQLANRLTSIGFIWFLGMSPASALVNLTQGAQVTLPVLGGKHGWSRAGRVLAATTGAAMRSGGHIEKTLTNPEERRALRVLETRGDIDRTQAHTLAALAEGDQLAANPTWNRVMGGISWMFHKAEIINREAAGIAAFRLGRADGMSFDQAVQYASDTINGTQLDYSRANRARYMQGSVAKVALQFKAYSLGMSWVMYRNLYLAFKGESPEVRKVARRTFTGIMGMTALLAGVVGLPFINGLALVANAAHLAFGDDDEPWDFITEFREWLAEHFGVEAGRIIADGPTNLLGANVSSRVSLSNLWFRAADRQLEGRDAYYHTLETFAGPLGGLVKNLYVGTDDVSKGHLWRGVERMLPTAVKNGMKAMRYAHEGANTLRGDPIIQDPSAAEDILQALGFQPTRLAEQWRQNSALMNYSQQVQDRRRSLMNAFAMAIHADDAEARSTVLRKIAEFNRHYPTAPVNAASLRRSLRGRASYSARAEGGIALPRRIAAKVKQDVGEF
ncbi:MAG TPA: PLxRFG domain-containing protein [Rhodanobacteraceae bacterium]|nr:PLxRFG domain-containing protein [Rhodanobacteraceae bacterium]